MRHIFFLLALCLCTDIYAQRHDNIWLYGWGNSVPTNPQFGGYKADFSTIPPVFSRARKPMDFTGFTMSMCDSVGNLQFYSNGLRIANRLNQTMENGDTIGYNNGIAWNYALTNLGGAIRTKGGMTLPLPSQEGIYYFFYESLEVDSNLRNTGVYDYLSIVDMRQNNGLGKVVLKDSLLMNDGYYMPTACKHANGRDWWVVFSHGLTQNQFLTMLLTPDGIVERRIETVGQRTVSPRGILSTLFTPDGERYALLSNNGFIRILGFDRCNGTFTFERDLPCSYGGGSISISPNSRYLYRIDAVHIAQQDLYNPQVQLDTVAIGNATNIFFQYSQLMPDGKIYISPTGSGREIHIIHAPDSAGMACRVQPIALVTVFNWSSMPYFPNYRLGPLRGSGCDTLTSLSPPTPDPKGEVKVYPNPTSGLVNIEVPEGLVLTELRVYDALGRLVLRKQEGIGASLDISVLPNGVYLLELRNEGASLSEGNEGVKRMKVLKQ